MLRLVSGLRTSDPPVGSRHDELSDLVRSVQRGDATALRTFLSVTAPHLLRVVRRVLGPGHPDVEDVAHEAAYALLQSLSGFRGEGTVLHFACRIAVLTAMNVRRRDAAQKRARVREAWDPDVVEADQPNPEEQVLSGTLAPAVRELLDTLPEPLAEALALHTILGYTVAEVATACGVPSETVRSRLRLAKQALRKRVLGHPTLREVAEVPR